MMAKNKGEELNKTGAMAKGQLHVPALSWSGWGWGCEPRLNDSASCSVALILGQGGQSVHTLVPV